MFPHFDNLDPSEIEQNTATMTAAGVAEVDRILPILIRLKKTWSTCRDASVVSARLSVGDGLELPGPTRSGPEWYTVLCRVLEEMPNPPAVLQAAEEYVRATPVPAEAFELFAATPRSLEILARLAAGSPFLTRIVIGQPDSLRSLASECGISEMKSREQFIAEAAELMERRDGPPLVALREYQRLELLRIGMCDAFGLLNLRFVTLQLSLLADAMVAHALRLACDACEIATTPFAVVALGKLGGEELNYSSDIDLVLVAERGSRRADRVARAMVDGLNVHLATGFLYRVDLRVRPWGNAGPLITSRPAWLKYLRGEARLWEKQALLKARVIAGDAACGDRFLRELPEFLFTESQETVRESIRALKHLIEAQLGSPGRRNTEVKLGIGSIRDVEFLVQSLQLVHGRTEPRLASANTLDALIRLAEFGLIDGHEYQQLRDGYVFLRAIEHALQLLQNRQTHEIPRRPELQNWLARRLDYPNATTFLRRFDEHRGAIRRIFDARFTPVTSRKPGRSSGLTRSQRPIAPPATVQPEDAVRLPDQLLPLSDTLRQLNDRRPTVVCGATAAHDGVVLTVCALDEPGLLSAVSGLMFAEGLDIRAGRVVSGPGVMGREPIPSGLFIASLAVRSQDPQRPELADPIRLAEGLQHRLSAWITGRRTGRGQQAQGDLLREFCARMAQTTLPPGERHLEITDRTDDDQTSTVVDIHSHDAPGFLFELANALHLCGFRIRQADIAVQNGLVRDLLRITSGEAEGPLSQARRLELRTTVNLIAQFTLWLPSLGEPYRLLQRFRRLLQSLLKDHQDSGNPSALRSPQVLSQVARVLGLSRHLWEDALLLEPAALLSLLTQPVHLEKPVSRAALTAELQREMRECDFADCPAALNRFKDRHLFRIELRHVLGKSREFGIFSREITTLAEVVLLAAVQLAKARLQDSADRPSHWHNSRWTLAALGKFGGVEMGFASDIELLLLYDDPDGGSDSVASAPAVGSGRDCAVWFERLLAEATSLITSRRDGIFQVDLRMRPWGQAGSPAVSLRQFSKYYSAEGPAWPYERQALVRLRCFGGDADFAEEVMIQRNQLVYDQGPFDFTAMQGLREQQIRQHVRPGTLNAKLSDGGLVDLEYAVQALQITFGHGHSSLRTANTMEAMRAAAAAGLAARPNPQAVCESYIFLRQLIDCLRMVRGNAKDLTVPPAGSAAFRELDRRLRQVYGDTVALDELSDHLRVVREFAAEVVRLCRPEALGGDE